MVSPGLPSVCLGTVVHHRHVPTPHRFSYPVTQIWLDPDDPDELCRHHRLWSASRPAPIWFRRRDYFDGSRQPISPGIRQLIATKTGRTVTGPLRMLTQPRTWGWVFNPITIYLAWDGADGPPVAAVLEVTNTPWKERHHYTVPLTAQGPGTSIGADFDKVLHVSPFLDMDYQYRLKVHQSARPKTQTPTAPDRLTINLDVRHQQTTTDSSRCIQAIGEDERGGEAHRTPEEETPRPVNTAPTTDPVLTTTLVLDRLPASSSTLGQALRSTPLPTHRVSAGIHRQATNLLLKRVPFVSHPKRKANR